MANHLRGEVDVQAEDKTYTFRLGINEMIELQNALGLSDDSDAFTAIFDERRLRNLKTIRTIVFHGLKRLQPDVTEELAGEIVTSVGLVNWAVIVQKALVWALPERATPAPGGAEPRPSPGPPS